MKQRVLCLILLPSIVQGYIFKIKFYRIVIKFGSSDSFIQNRAALNRAATATHKNILA